MNIDVLTAGAGPNGLLMAGELALAGVRPVVLERLPERATRPKANGLVGRIVPALDYRGLYEPFSGNSTPPAPVPGFQFGALQLPLHTLDSNPMYILPIPQRRLEALLEQRAAELGVTIRRRHEVAAVHQGPDEVTVDVHGPDGEYRLAARFLVAADGGTQHDPQAAAHRLPGGHRQRLRRALRPGRHRPASGGRHRRAGRTRPRPAAARHVHPHRHRPAVHRVLGYDLPIREPADGQPAALARTIGVNSRQAERYRHGRVFLIGDAAHPAAQFLFQARNGRLDQNSLARQCATPRRTLDLAAALGRVLPELPERVVPRQVRL